MAILQRKILFGGIAILIVLAILSVVFLYQPKIQARGKIQAEANNLRKQINDMKEQVKGIGALRRQISQLETQNSELMSHVAPRDQLLTLLRELAKIGERYNITFLEITPPGLDTMLQAENQDTPIRPVPFQIVMQGRYLDIGAYVENLNQFSYFVKVPEFEINGKDEIRPAIEARLLLNIYTSSLPFAQPIESIESKNKEQSLILPENLKRDLDEILKRPNDPITSQPSQLKVPAENPDFGDSKGKTPLVLVVESTLRLNRARGEKS